MPSLDWIGKASVLRHHKDVPYRLLEPVPELSCNADSPDAAGNLIVQGDNLHALKALLPRYAGQVKCIYIDPPYNTGNEGWAYNDNVNSPEIRRWLGEVVGKEGETLDRHDRWLCMMYPRLVLLRQFLRDDGAIFVSIDDNEIANLIALMREIYGSANEVATIVWEKGKKGDSKLVSVTHEYIVAFAKNKTLLKKLDTRWRRRKAGVDAVLSAYQQFVAAHGENHAVIRKEMMAWYRGLPKTDPRKAHKHYNWSDARGLYFAADFAGPDDGRESRPRYDILHPKTSLPCAVPSTGWRWEAEKTRAALAESPPRIHFGKDHTTIPNRKSYLFEVDEEPVSSVFYRDGRAATLEVEAMLGPGAFQFPKDSEVIAQLIGAVVEPGDLVMDSFAGSGTTAHAVLRLNQGSTNPVHFILIELEPDVAKYKTRVRVARAIEGYKPLTGKNPASVEGLGGGFQYATLSENPLFTPTGDIRADVRFDDLAELAWHIEAGSGAICGQRRRGRSPLLGITDRKAIFLLYNGILADRGDTGGNVLNSRTLDILKAEVGDFAGPWVVYGARTRFDPERLASLRIEFKMLPYRLQDVSWA